jgi:ribosomal protein L37AE/L43A
MERCPRCGSTPESITLDGVTTWYCEDCGYADVPVEHSGEYEDEESWQDALNRFYEEFGS